MANLNHTDSSSATGRESENMAKKEGKPSMMARLKAIWAKAGLDAPTVLMMAKGGLPPTIALCMYQALSVANIYTTLGYLIGISSILGFAIMPRAKFFQTMFLNVLAICLATAVAMLAMWSALQARIHTTRIVAPGPAGTPVPGAQTAQYNSSASAVCAIFLFVQTYLVNTFKAKNPQLLFPTILYSIFTNVSMTYGPQWSTNAQFQAFGRRLLTTFLTGFGLATGVSLFIIPVTSRSVVFKEITGYIGALRKTIKAQRVYLQSLEEGDVFGKRRTRDENGQIERTPNGKAAQAALAEVTALHGKLHGDLPFAKREIAVGKLDASDLGEIYRILRSIMLPLNGLAATSDIFQRYAETMGFIVPSNELGMDDGASLEPTRSTVVSEWNSIMRSLREPLDLITQAMDDGLEHCLLTLELKKRPKAKKAGVATQTKGLDGDIEAKAGSTPQPGEQEFHDHLERVVKEFRESKKHTLRAWCAEKGIYIPDDFFDNPDSAPLHVPPEIVNKDSEEHNRSQRQLFLVLYMEFLLEAAARAIHGFVGFSNLKVASGKMQRNRLIVPGVKRLRKWFKSLFHAEDANSGDHHMGDLNGTISTVWLGDAFKRRKDPEHLPPQSLWEKLGDAIRGIPGFLRSPESAFGFRVAVATMSIGIIAYLEASQRFFVRQRLVWGMIMIAISMTPTAGQSTFGFLLRILGTLIATIAAFIVWYIVDGHTVGVLIFFYIFASSLFYIIIKFPRFIMVGMISVVTLTLIIGYELEVKRLGPAVATSNGQPYYPTYKLAPYRLLCVTGGLTVAWIWTIFPYPITEHSQLRKDLGASMYLLANYYSVVHETVRARIRGDEGNMDFKDSPGRRLERARNKVYAKLTMMLVSLRQYSAFLKFEIQIGGKFPKKQYDGIVNHVQHLLDYMSLMGFASAAFVTTSPIGQHENEWLEDFRRLINSARITSQEVTTLLALISASITHGRPLPPYLVPPRPYRLSTRLEQIDPQILSVRHINEPGYAAFAVMQIATRCVIGDLEKLLKDVKQLVGELDFSFHTVSTASESTIDVEGDKGKTD